MLCALCIWMLQKLPEGGDHHTSFDHVTLAASAGCRVCKSLCRYHDDYSIDEDGYLPTNPFCTYTYENYSDTSPRIIFEISAPWFKRGLALELSLQVAEPETTPEWWPAFLKGTRLDLHNEPWRVRKDQFPCSQIPTNTGRVEVLHLASDWLTARKGQHLNCDEEEAVEKEKFYPPRLVDLAQFDMGLCHLVIAKDTLLDGSGYVALSHCWGERPSFLTLTNENIDNCISGISISSVPKSFMDAMQTSIMLGFRYIWIDSLCILQSGPGSDEDWRSHAVTMGSIYARCELNISIAWASNAEAGAFLDRDPNFLQHAYVQVPTSIDFSVFDDAPHSDISIAQGSDSVGEAEDMNEKIMPNEEIASDSRLSRRVTIFVGIYDFQNSLWNLPLLKRGWVIQERLMAPRTLYFGKDRIYWECKEKCLNEYLPWGLANSGSPFDVYYKRAYSLPNIVMSESTGLNPPEIPCWLHTRWERTVEDYSITKLTYPIKDKLVAISSLARRFGCQTQSEYIAGIFRSYLPFSLLWVTRSYRPYKFRGGYPWPGEDEWEEEIHLDEPIAEPYQAPSWSWASRNTQIYHIASSWGYEDLQPWQESRQILSSVVAIEKNLVDPQNPWGQVKSASITIEGLGAELKCFADGEQSDSGPCFLKRLPRRTEMYSDQDKLFSFHIFEESRFKKIGGTQPCIYGLVLASRDLVTYKRIGSYRCVGPVGSRYPSDNFERITLTIT